MIYALVSGATMGLFLSFTGIHVPSWQFWLLLAAFVIHGEIQRLRGLAGK